jgi:hypothetical protein
MKYRLSIYNLLVNKQSEILEMLKFMDVKNPKEKIKSILDVQMFEILECTEYEITKIKKKSTNEIFEKGCSFYDKKYKVWTHNMHFDERLIGSYYNEKFYKNFVIGDGGIYQLSDISLSDNVDEILEIKKEIVLDGITYVVKE